MLEFKPTTSLAKLLANNTSAASAFPGWPNGVAKPSAIGLTSMGIPQAYRFLHRVNWWGSASHPNIGYASSDPVYVAQTIADMKARGYNGASLLWNGSSYPEAKATLAQKVAFESSGLVFIPMAGSSNPALGLPPATHPNMTTTQRTVEVNKLLDFFRSTFFTSPAQFRINGRPVVQWFGVVGVDWPTIVAHAATFGADRPLFFFRWENDGKYGDRKEADGYYGWRSCTEAWVKGVLAYKKLVMLGLNAGFDSSHAELPVHCTWGNTDPRPQLGGLRRIQQLALAAAHPEITMVQECTWDDYQEGSPIEPGIATGATLALAFDDAGNKLTCADPGAAFDRIALYVGSPAAPDLMWLDDFKGGLSADLGKYDLPLGPWAFVALAVGKNSIQNVASNSVTANKFSDWR